VESPKKNVKTTRIANTPRIAATIFNFISASTSPGRLWSAGAFKTHQIGIGELRAPHDSLPNSGDFGAVIVSSGKEYVDTATTPFLRQNALFGVSVELPKENLLTGEGFGHAGTRRRSAAAYF
jgi:hypothetical protein